MFPSQPFFVSTWCVLSIEAANTNFIVSGLAWPQLEHHDIPNSHANLYTLDAVLNLFSKIDYGWKKHSKVTCICIIKYIYNRNLLWQGSDYSTNAFLIYEKKIDTFVYKIYGIFINDCPYHNLAHLLRSLLNYLNV